MIIQLDIVTRNKLILVKQLYQRAFIQSQNIHTVVDRMLAIVGFDLANETLLKTIALSLNPTTILKRSFPDVIKQVEAELVKHNQSFPDIIKITKIHDYRNATQHHGRFPSEIEISDSRTYTRDFLENVFFTIWGESIDSLSLVDAIQNTIARNHLRTAENHLTNKEFSDVVAKSIASFKIVFDGIANQFTETIDGWIDGIVVSQRSKEIEPSKSVFQALIETRELIVFQLIGINSLDYLKYKRFSNSIIVNLLGEERFTTLLIGREPTKDEAEYVLNFVINAIIQVENLDKEIMKSKFDFT